MAKQRRLATIAIAAQPTDAALHAIQGIAGGIDELAAMSARIGLTVEQQQLRTR